MREWITYICLGLSVFFMTRKCGASKELPAIITTVDTVIFRDTIYCPVPVPREILVTRIDTIRITRSDTMVVEVPVEIERKEYRTDDYLAVVEGWRAELVRLDLFPENKVITNTVYYPSKQRPRLGVGIQAGYGFNGQKTSPYVGVGVQWNLWCW